MRFPIHAVLMFLAAITLQGCGTAPIKDVAVRERLVAVTVPESYYVTDELPSPPSKEKYMAMTDKERETALGQFAAELQLYAYFMRERVKTIGRVSLEIKQRIEESNR